MRQKESETILCVTLAFSYSHEYPHMSLMTRHSAILERTNRRKGSREISG
jgi:hypothetical protein